MITVIFAVISVCIVGLIFWLWCKCSVWSKWGGAILALFAGGISFFLLYSIVGIDIKVQSFNKNLQQNYPIFSIIAEQSPDAYDQFLAQIKTGLRMNVSQNDIEELTFALMNRVYPKYLATAPDESIYADLTATMALYEKIAQDYPVLVLKLEFPERFAKVNIVRLDNPEYKLVLEDSRKAKTELIKDAINDPQSAPTAELVEPEIARIINNLIDEYGEDLVAGTFNGGNDQHLDKKSAAKVLITFYQQLLAQMPEGAGALVRFFSSETIASPANAEPVP